MLCPNPAIREDFFHCTGELHYNLTVSMIICISKRMKPSKISQLKLQFITEYHLSCLPTRICCRGLWFTSAYTSSTSSSLPRGWKSLSCNSMRCFFNTGGTGGNAMLIVCSSIFTQILLNRWDKDPVEACNVYSLYTLRRAQWRASVIYFCVTFSRTSRHSRCILS